MFILDVSQRQMLPPTRICSTGWALSLNVREMKAKLVTTICVLAICLGSVATARASENSGPLTVTVDAVVIRPACLVATALGSAVFVVALPVAAVSRSEEHTSELQSPMYIV